MIKMEISEYIKTTYAPGSEPVAKTLIRRIKAKKLNGRKEGGRYYVFVDSVNPSSGNPLVDRVLKGC